MCDCPDGTPDHLIQRGRPEVQSFRPEDNLYFRFAPPLDGDEEERIENLDLAHIKFPNQSVNWDRFSEPEDVVFGAPPGSGIATLLVRQIPPEIVSEGGPVYEFKPVHQPNPCNYAHAEIQVFKENENGVKVNIRASKVVPKNVKLRYRAMLRDAAKVLAPSRQQAA